MPLLHLALERLQEELQALDYQMGRQSSCADGGDFSKFLDNKMILPTHHEKPWCMLASPL